MQEPVRSIESLIVAHIREELDNAGQEQLNTWKKKGDNKALFDRITNVQNLRQGLLIVHETAQRKDFLKARLDRAIHKKATIIKSLKYTAAAIIAGAFIAAAYFTFNVKENDLAVNYNLMNWLANRQLPVEFHNSVSTGYGQRTSFVLPDNSIVHLNSASTIRYSVIPMSLKRTVELSGEGSFEVVNRNQQPFDVLVKDPTGKRKVNFEVLGTTFNLNAYYDEDVIKATLLKGILKIEVAGTDQVLYPGQQAIIGPAGVISINRVDVNDEITWQQGKIRYHNASIRTVMRMVARQYGIKPVFDHVEREGYNGVISNSLTLQEALDMLESTTEYHFDIKGNLVTVRSKALQR